MFFFSDCTESECFLEMGSDMIKRVTSSVRTKAGVHVFQSSSPARTGLIGGDQK